MKKNNQVEQDKTVETNEDIQEAFYDENEDKDVNPANLNNQTAILPKNE